MNSAAMVCCLLVLAPAAAAAQSISGEADWGFARSAYRIKSQAVGRLLLR